MKRTWRRPMNKKVVLAIGIALLTSSAARAQATNDPFPVPIAATDRVISVKFSEFATIPDFNGAAPRIMTMLYEPGSQRLFASDMNGKLYTISADGKAVGQYLD